MNVTTKEFKDFEVRKAMRMVKHLKDEIIQNEIITLMAAGMDPSRFDRYQTYMKPDEEQSQDDDEEDFQDSLKALERKR